MIYKVNEKTYILYELFAHVAQLSKLSTNIIIFILLRNHHKG